MKEEKKKEKTLNFYEVDRSNIIPCKNCRKNQSCILRPNDEKCLGFEKGIPWIMPD